MPVNTSAKARQKRNMDDSEGHDPYSEVKKFDSPTKRYRQEQEEMDGFGKKAKRSFNPTEVERGSHDTKVETE